VTAVSGLRDVPPEAAPAPLLEVSELTLRFGGVSALTDVSFTVAPGELLAIIGPNGAGKTSLFNCLNGAYRPQRGTIRLEGRDITDLRPSRRAGLGIARTFQNLALFTNLDVVDNLMLGRHHLMRSGVGRAFAWWGPNRRDEVRHRERCHEIAALLELTPFVGAPVGRLPYGVQKRIELGRALAMEPTVLLLDEPVAGMNQEETEDLAAHLLDVRDAMNPAILLVEHDMHLVMDLADRVVALDFGQVIATGTPADVAEDPDVIAAYLGASVD
jgi:branched-chain amino acid transport system ATP-binding protein